MKEGDPWQSGVPLLYREADGSRLVAVCFEGSRAEPRDIFGYLRDHAPIQRPPVADCPEGDLRVPEVSGERGRNTFIPLRDQHVNFNAVQTRLLRVCDKLPGWTGHGCRGHEGNYVNRRHDLLNSGRPISSDSAMNEEEFS
jgi:hypothetical protein